MLLAILYLLKKIIVFMGNKVIKLFNTVQNKCMKHNDKPNLILYSDSYKLTHHEMYPKNTTHIFSYLEARKGAKFDKTLFFGLQILLKKLEGVVVTKEHIEQAENICEKHIGPGVFNKNMWEHIVNNLGGKLPLEIKAIEEGMLIPVDNVLMTVINTDDKCAPLTNFFESYLMHVWYPCTVATLSKQCKNIITKYVRQTSDLDSNEQDKIISLMLHDFGYRGVSSDESAEIGGLAHLINFRGTDTLLALMCDKYYSFENNCPGISVCATEHSIMTANGKEGEFDVLLNLITNPKYDDTILSLVIDSYNYLDAIKFIGTTLKNDVLRRKQKLVLRPDSGDPIDVILNVLNSLGAYFGINLNSKGFMTLNPKIGIIYGDGIDLEKIDEICSNLVVNGWCVSNVVFGMGGGLLQKVNRDTQRFAFKCSAMKVDGKWRECYKEPISSSSDKETKKSKKGLLVLNKNLDGNFETNTVNPDDYELSQNLLKTVFKNGVIEKEFTFESIRNNAI